MYIHKLKIGNVELENNIILAPMAGITDLPFRVIAKKFRPGLVCTEMVSSKAIFHDDTKTKLLLKIDEKERPVSVQIFGSDIETMVYAAKYVEPIADIIDINMGCPAPKVVKNGDGSKLLLNLDLAEEIVREVVKVVDKPVTVKFRKGWNNTNIVAVEAAKRFEKAGASAITIHGRTREEYYSGSCDLDIIKSVKESVAIPVIGNGDIIDIKSAQKMFEYTGVDGIMIGRASLGNPWIFKNIIDGLNSENITINCRSEFGKEYQICNTEKRLYINKNKGKLTKEEFLDTILEHIDLAINEKGEYVGIREMRKHISGYTKNLPNSSEFREKMNRIEDKDKLISFITEYIENI